MQENLFIDERRLDDYFEQFAGPVVYDKVSIWKWILGVTGPKVEGVQDRAGRAPTVHEKIERLLPHLKEEGLLRLERTDDPMAAREYPFVLESCGLRKCQIDKSGRTVTIWFSVELDPASRTGIRRTKSALYLIEDFKGDEEGVMTFSGYSSLYLLAQELSWLEDDELGHPLEKLKNRDGATRHFAQDPLGSLEALGATIGPSRMVETLYRFRASCVDMEVENGRHTTIGYPIFIREGLK